MNIFKKLFGTTSEKEIRRIQPKVDKILSLEDEYSKLSDSDLKHKTVEFKDRLSKGETLDDILPEAFATVREASWRVLGMKHFPVQLIGGIILHQGRIAEMKTGEGKSLTATCPLYLNALAGGGAFLVTVNDYLAKRDSVMMGKVYGFLGLTTGLIVHDLEPAERRAAYACDITYGTNNEIGFDYLRDNMSFTEEGLVQRGFAYAIVDEVDSILIDEARTPLIISGFDGKSTEGYNKADEFVKSLKKKVVVEVEEGSTLDKAMAQFEGQEYKEMYADYDYVVEEKRKTSTLTDKGITKAEKFYGLKNLTDPENLEINHYITRALKANGLFKKDVDYVIKDGKVVIVDESTGRLMDGRRYSDGIHQAIEAKEGVEVQQESKTLASITFQNLFRKFAKLSGMTGTAKTEEEEFNGIYNLDVIEIPTNKPVIREDKPDRVYINRKGKLKAIVDTIKEVHAKGQPILIGTVSVEKSEELSGLLKREGISHVVLNAKYHEMEAQIVAQAGKLGAVTIATNMAGRGTDIILGGNPEYMALEELRDEGYSEELVDEAIGHSETTDEEILNIRKLFAEKEERIKEELAPEAEQVRAAGGLYILGSERHESRRIDNQLRGRSGRQGDPGVSEFVLSLEDDLMRLFGTQKLTVLAKNFNIPEDMPIDMGILSNQIEKAQHQIESRYYQMRKSTLEYDEVMAQQRDIIYEERAKVLHKELDFKETVLKMMREAIDMKVSSNCPNPKKITLEDIENLRTEFDEYSETLKIADYTEDSVMDITADYLKDDLIKQMEHNFEEVAKTNTDEFVQDYSRRLILFLVDSGWQEHMIEVDDLKEGIGLRAYAQTKPIDAFKFESFQMFDAMLAYIREDVLRQYMSIYKTECLDLGITSDKIVTVNSVEDGKISITIEKKEDSEGTKEDSKEDSEEIK